MILDEFLINIDSGTYITLVDSYGCVAKGTCLDVFNEYPNVEINNVICLDRDHLLISCKQLINVE